MAYMKTLSENWTLAGGVFDPFPIEKPMDVRRALSLYGLVKPRVQGLEALAEAWIYRCTWTYACDFEWSGEDERCQLECECTALPCAVAVNGVRIADDFRPGEASLDISGAMVEGQNHLALSFPPPAPDVDAATLGLLGGVRLRVGNGMTLSSFDAIGRDGRIGAHTQLFVYASGRYVFHYVVALEDDAVCDHSFTEALRLGAVDVQHDLPVERPLAYDPTRIDATLYTVRLSIERLGVGCQLAFARAYFAKPEQSPMKLCRVPSSIPREALEARAALLHQLGVDGLILERRAALAPELGFLPAEDVEGAHEVGAFAVLQGDDMHELAGGEKYWPPGGPLWRLTSSGWPEDLDLDALFGPNAMGDAGRAARFVRFLQAERVRRMAYRARILGKPAVIDWPFEEMARYGSRALIEFGGEARPAYDALEEAFAPVAVCAQLPHDMRVRPGEQVRVGAYLLCSGPAHGTVTVDIACHLMDGTLLGATSLPAMLGGDARVGELTVTLPKVDGVVLVRVLAKQGGDVLASSDWTLCVCGGDAPLAPLMNLKAARLTQRDGLLVNEGRETALAVCSLGYRALLPGEGMRCADTYECLGGLV